MINDEIWNKDGRKNKMMLHKKNHNTKSSILKFLSPLIIQAQLHCQTIEVTLRTCQLEVCMYKSSEWWIGSLCSFETLQGEIYCSGLVDTGTLFENFFSERKVQENSYKNKENLNKIIN